MSSLISAFGEKGACFSWHAVEASNDEILEAERRAEEQLRALGYIP